MTYVVGWSPFHRDPGAVELACSLARTSGDELYVVSAATAGWGGLGRKAQAGDVDLERALGEAREIMNRSGVTGEVVAVTAKSVPQALLDAAKQKHAKLLVVGSGTDAAAGRIGLSSKSNRLVHSSPVPVALAPRNYRASDERVPRVTCAYRNAESSKKVLDEAQEFADRSGIPLRLVTFGVEPRRMYPGEVSGGDTMIVEQWRQQSKAELTKAAVDLGRADLETFLASGRTWEEALRDVDWQDSEILVVGSSSTNPIAAVFLGSSATKILQASPVPIVVMP